MKKAWLEVKEGSSVGRKYPLWDGFMIGRALECDLVISDKRASRRHARVDKRNGDFWLVDLKSSNKTFVNGIPIQEKKLEAGDMVRIASLLFIFREKEEADELPSPGLSESQVFMVQRDFERTTFEEARALRESDIENLAGFARDPQSDRVISILVNLFEVSKKLNTIHDIDTLLDEILSLIFKTLPNAEHGFIMLPEGPGGRMVERVVKTRSGNVQVSASRTVIERALEKREAILSRNTLDDESFRTGKSIIAEGIRSVLCVPMMRYSGGREELLGLIYIDTTRIDQPFTRIDLNILSAIAGQAAVAVKNAQLVEEVKRNTEFRTSLQRYLSPDVVEQVLDRRIDIGLGGEMKKGAVLFSDIIGFTTMTERLDPATLVKMLNRYFNRMVEIIFSNEGTVDKFGGDSVLAVWGAPRETPLAPNLALKTAMDMQVELFEMNMREKWPEHLNIGIGIATGRFLAGNIGSERRMEYTVIGHTVNLAQRLESLAGGGMILTEETTVKALNTPVAAVTFDPVTLKGMSNPIVIYSIRGVVENRSPLRVALNIPALVRGQGGKETQAWLVGFFEDRFERLFLRVVTTGALEPDRRFTVIPLVPETPSIKEIRAFLADNDTAVQLAGGMFKGRTLRVNTEESDATTLQFLSCELKLSTPVKPSELKSDVKNGLQD